MEVTISFQVYTLEYILSVFQRADSGGDKLKEAKPDCHQTLPPLKSIFRICRKSRNPSETCFSLPR